MKWRVENPRPWETNICPRAWRSAWSRRILNGKVVTVVRIKSRTMQGDGWTMNEQLVELLMGTTSEYRGRTKADLD